MKSKSKMTKVFVWSVFHIALVLLLLLQPGRAQAATFVVNSTADAVDFAPGNGYCASAPGVCNLRAAIMETNALPGADTITVPAGTYMLTIPGVNEAYSATGDLDITSDLTITGAGANMTTIDAGGIDRVLEIRTATTTNVRISGLTVTGGKTLALAPGVLGGGGGIHTSGGLLTLTSVTVSGNTAGSQGGGIFKAGPLTLNSCTVSNNTAGFEPGTPGGGGIMDYINGTLTLNNSTISGNTSPWGGGIGSSNYSLDISMTNSTVSNNTGGGLQVRAGSVTMKNTILANGGFNCYFTGYGPAVLISLGHNLSTDNSCAAPIVNATGGLDSAKGDFNNTPAQLAPLELNLPGSTKTHALCTGLGAPHPSCGAIPSPAIDKGGDCLAMDQRGVPRPQGAACDIGAYEVGSAPPAAACATPPPNMVAWWPMNETSGTTVTDIVGSHNGTARPAPIGAFAAPGPVTSSLWPPPTLPVGVVNNSLFFRGDRRVEIPSHADLEPGTGDFTIDAWVNYAASGNGQFLTVARKALGNGGTPTTAPLGFPGGIGYEMVIQDYSPGKGILSFTMQGAGQGNLGTGGPYITPNTWHHVAFTLQRTSTAATTTIYLDGSSIGSTLTTPWTYGNIGNTWNLLIGGDGVLAGNIAVDEVEIFKRALSQSEIQAIFRAGSAGKCKCVPPPSGLVSWWPGDGNANDVKDGNNGTLINGAIFSAGKVGQAFSFDGVGDYVAVPDSANLDITGEITLDAWIKTSGTSDYSGVVGKILPNEPRSGYLVTVSPDSKVRCDIIRARPPQGTVLSTTLVEDGNWHYVACTYDGAVVKVYVDGKLEGSVSYTDGIGVTNEPLLIGRDPHSAPSRDFTGIIDEVEVYNRALTQQQIQAIFNAGSAGKCKIIVSPNKPPLANAGPDQTVEATGPSGAAVTLNGSGSSDPDGNPLTYNWTGPFGTVSAVSHTVTLPLGTHTVTLTVNDRQATATDTVSITVRDTTPPDTIINSAVDGNGAAVASGGSTLSGSITLTFGGTDTVGVAGFQCSRDGSVFAPCTSPAGYSALAISSHTIQVRALDAAGNVDASPASFTWAVITPAQAIENLITTINNMGLAGGVATSLTAPLNNINTNNKAAACAKLNAFINQVDAKVQNGQLTSAQGSQLLQAANAIKAGLGC